MEDIVMKVALSHSGMTLNRDNFENMKKSGIDAVEVALGYSFAEILDYKAIAKFAADAGVLLWSSHLPLCRTTSSIWRLSTEISETDPDR